MINITLVDDHHIVREGVRNLIETNSNYKIVEEYDNAEEFLFNVKKSKSDLLITDISLPGMSGIELTSELRKNSYQSKIIILSMHDDHGHINEAFDSGANGYLLKDCSREDLFAALTDVICGKKYISKSAIKSLSSPVMKGSELSLSVREKEIIKLLAEGKSSEEIAAKLGLSGKTISNHRTRIMGKLEAKNSSEVIAKALKNNLI